MRISEQNLVEKLLQNAKAVDILRSIKPADLISVLLDFGLSGKQSKEISNELIKKVKEGIHYPSIETNKRYPVPASSKKESAAPMGKNSFGSRDPVDARKFPPPPRAEPGEWPYDKMTVAAMQTGKGVHQGRGRPLQMSKEPGISDKGIHRKSAPHSKNQADPHGWGQNPKNVDFDPPPNDRQDPQPIAAPRPTFTYTRKLRYLGK